MTTIIVSDVHLGDPACRINDFLRFLLETKAKHIVFAGDLWDLWLMSPRKFQERFERVISVLKVLKAGGTRFEYILGNHDETYLKDPVVPLELLPVVDQVVIELRPCQKLVVRHGHEFDKYLKELYFLYKLGFYLKMFRRMACPSWWHDNPTKFSKLTAEIHRAAAQTYGTAGYQGIVMGHTHVAQDRTDDLGFRILDCGAWLTDQLHYVEVEGDTAQLRRIT